MSPRGWEARLQDIVEAGESIAEETAGLDEATFVADRTKLYAVLYLLVVVGEAAANVPPEITARYPEADWAGARQMRNFAVHRYFGVKASIVWRTAVDDVPSLVAAIREGIARGTGH